MKYIKAIYAYLDELLGDEIIIRPYEFENKQYYSVVSKKTGESMFDFAIGHNGWFLASEPKIYFGIASFFSIGRDTARNYFKNWFFEKHGMNSPEDFKRFISEV